MFLSIIIPHYNLPKELLERCIESIAKQDIAAYDYEIIIVDDGSATPPTWVESRYTDINIKLITAPHGGPGAARNRGIEEAKGTYIEFVDADDTLIPGSEYRQCIDKLRTEMPQILHFSYRVLPPGSKPQTKKSKNRVLFSNTISGAPYMKEFNLPGSPCCYFVSKDLLFEKEIRVPSNIFHEDEEFNTILHFHARTLAYSDATLYNYCIREGSTTANSSTEFEENRINDMLHIIERLHHFGNTQQNCSKIQERGFKHKMTMLSVDAIVNIMFNGMSARDISAKCSERLAPLGLYPLPRASYSTKYRMFRLLANSKFGMKILRTLIPSKKPAKQ